MAYDAIGPLLESMLNVIQPHLTAPVNRAVLMPGNLIIEDDCCESGGQLHVQLVSIVGASALSNPRLMPCAQMYQVRVKIGTRRCVHTLSDQGTPPLPIDMIRDVKAMMQDRADIMEAIICSVLPLLEADPAAGEKSLRIEDWLPSNTGGGCQGGDITITFSHLLCTDCPEETP